MAPLPTIHLIHASDAPQHLGKLKEILQKLKAENRISDIVTLKIGDDLSSLNKIEGEDGALILLTDEIEPQKKEIRSKLKTLKVNHSSVKIVEIIVDNVPYENEFLTYPTDYEPIRDRDNMDAVWNNIEQSLKVIFPVLIIPEKPQNDDWKKYLKYAIPAIVIIALLLWWAPWEAKTDDGTDGLIAGFTADKTECEAPCTVAFNNVSQNADTYGWDFGDGQNSMEVSPSHTYSEPGDYTVKLIAQRGDQQHEKTDNLTITSPGDNVAFKVTDVAATVSGANSFSGACPHKFDFNGTITVNKAGTVSYTWLRSDGATAAVQTLNFSEAGSQTVSTSWTLGGAGNTYNDMWQQVKILEPSEMVSDKAVFNLICENDPITFFMGEWKNEDVETRGITKAAIRTQNNDIFVHMWGSCSPTDCDWGETKTTISDASDQELRVTWDQGFVIREQRIKYLDGNRLEVTSNSHYTDNSGRLDNEEVYYFIKN